MTFLVLYRASDNSREKKWNFTGFEETNSRRQWSISRDFWGKFSLKSKQESKKEILLTKILEGCQIQGKKEKQKFIQHSSEGNCTCFELQEKQIKLYRNAWPVNLLFQLQFRAENSNALNFFPFIALLCCFAVVLNHCLWSVRLNVCLHYYRQQFPFTLRIVSTKCVLFYCVNEIASLRQVNSSNSQDKFQICFTDMYLVEFLANFAVFHVFLSISRDFADLREFRGSATARNFRSPASSSVANQNTGFALVHQLGDTNFSVSVEELSDR